VARRSEVAALLNELAPPSLAESWDNPGWQIRLEDGPLGGVLVSLDATPSVVEEAASLGANLLVTHHPLFFRPPRSVDAESLVGSTALAAIRSGVSIFATHTNLDAAPGGTSWALAEALGLAGGRLLEPRSEPGCGYGLVVQVDQSRRLDEWAALVSSRLAGPPLARSGDPASLHRVVALMGGSGSGQIGSAVAAGASLLLTADIRYHEAQQAQAFGLSLLVLDHYASESPVLARIAEQLGQRLDCPVRLSTQRTSPWEVHP
jgi:dinuclear metal center YbgI/SA1388 family protein